MKSGGLTLKVLPLFNVLKYLTVIFNIGVKSSS
jgi:hypothetical protein